MVGGMNMTSIEMCANGMAGANVTRGLANGAWLPIAICHWPVMLLLYVVMLVSNYAK